MIGDDAERAFFVAFSSAYAGARSDLDRYSCTSEMLDTLLRPVVAYAAESCRRSGWLIETRFNESNGPGTDEIAGVLRHRPDATVLISNGEKPARVYIEVERGRAIENNNVFRDFWKAHVDRSALILVVPESYVAGSAKITSRVFETVGRLFKPLFHEAVGQDPLILSGPAGHQVPWVGLLSYRATWHLEPVDTADGMLTTVESTLGWTNVDAAEAYDRASAVKRLERLIAGFRRKQRPVPAN
jgi:hypothetical protein